MLENLLTLVTHFRTKEKNFSETAVYSAACEGYLLGVRTTRERLVEIAKGSTGVLPGDISVEIHNKLKAIAEDQYDV